MAQRSPENACVEYAIAVAEVRRCNAVMSAEQNLCDVISLFRESGAEQLNGTHSPSSCLDDLFERHDPEMESRECFEESQAELRETMCDGCKERLAAVEARKDARKRLGAAKRSVEAVGKRMNAECKRERQEAEA